MLCLGFELFGEADAALIRASRPTGETGAAAARAALSAVARRAEQSSETSRLAMETVLPQIELPFLFRADVDLDAVGELSRLLAPSLEAIA